MLMLLLTMEAMESYCLCRLIICFIDLYCSFFTIICLVM